MKATVFAAIGVLLLVGCTSRVTTHTPRSAIEQLLLTGAVDKALEKLDVPGIEGKKVFLDFKNLQAYDAAYIQAATRARFSQLGAMLLEKPDGSDLVAEVASGAYGTEFKNAIIGLPPLPVPNSPVPMPETALFKHVEQTGIVKLLIFVHAQGQFVSVHQYYAKMDRDENFVLWWRFTLKDDIRKGWNRADYQLKPTGAPSSVK